MNVLIGCEFSGIVREAFTRRGHNAISCDLLPSELYGPHLKDDVRAWLHANWDLAIFFPPCTHLAISGARWFAQKQKEQADALQFIRTLLDAPIPRIALENPVGVISTFIRKPDQIIQPYQFGHPEKKKTCLWLKNRPKLVPTNVVPGIWESVWKASPSPERWKFRSRTFPGVAEAMATQWSF